MSNFLVIVISEARLYRARNLLCSMEAGSSQAKRFDDTASSIQRRFALHSLTVNPRFRQILHLLVILLSARAARLRAQTPPPRLVSPEVHSDNTVTFRFRAPNAHQVMLSLEGTKAAVPMEKDAEGVWSHTTAPLDPDFYGYDFLVDGLALIDPNNWLMKPNLLGTSSMAHVPGPSSLPWEVNDVPHGVIHHHFYKSGVVGDQRDYFVYTPPRYNPKAKQNYPVLYLLHGFSDDASGWSAVGLANVVLDNLIGQGKAKPMLVVMPLGYGAPEIVSRGFENSDDVLRQRNYDRFTQTLLTEVIPQVESSYRVSRKREARAIAGLSMGGAESLLTGLNHRDEFAWIGAFSSGRFGTDFAARFPSLDASANQQLRLLWIACGVDDSRLADNRQFREWLKSKGVNHVDIETPGMHAWMVWRRNLADFSQLLFR
jgi:enterochelin esterase-like enzyme